MGISIRLIDFQVRRNHYERSLVSLISEIIESVGISTDPNSSKVTWWANVGTVNYVICFFLQCVALVTAKDSTRMFECFSVLSFCCMGMLKLFALRVYRNKWLFILEEMKTLEIKHGSKEIPEEEYESDDETIDLTTYVQEYTKKFKSVSALLPRIYWSTAIGFVLSPYIEYAFLKFTGNSPKYPHIIPCWTPLDQFHIIGYMATCYIEFVTSVYCVLVHVAFDSSSAGVMIFAKGQFLLLRRYCENIAGRGNKCNITIRRDKRAMHRIKHSHQSSLILGNVVEEFGKMLKNIMGIYYFQTTLTLCTVAMRLKMEVLSVTELLSLVQYLGAILIQLFHFCYYGDAIYEVSTVSLGQGPSGAAYWCISPRVRRQLSLLAIGTTRAQRIRAGPFHFLDLPSFLMIIRGAYSYYAVMGK